MAAPAGGDKKNIVKMAYIYFQEGRWDKAIEEYKKLLALDPEDINTHNMLGDVYVKKGSAREAFEAYIKVSNDFSSRGATDKAAVVNKKIAALDTALLPPEAQKKQSLIKQTFKAETAMEQGDVDTAIAALTEVSNIDSDNLGAFYKLGELFEKKGQVAEAVKQYQMLGGVFLKNRLYKKAQELFQKVVQLDPNNTEGHVNLAQIHIKQGSESDAKKEYLSAADQAFASGDMENAQVYAAKAVELKSIEAHYVLGLVLFKKQKLTEAKAEFESLLRFKVNHQGALTNLGRVFLELNQTDKAAETIQKALKIEKDNPAAMEAWVEVCLKKGNKTEAATQLSSLIEKASARNDHAKAAEFARDLLSLDENSTTALSKLAQVLGQAGDRNGSADIFLKLAQQYTKEGKKDQASVALQKVLEFNPGHDEARRLLVEGGSASPAASHPAPAPKAAPPVHAPSPSNPVPAPTTAPPAAAAKNPAAGVLDLEQEIAKPFSQPATTPLAPAPAAVPAPVAAPAPVAKAKPTPEPEPQEELSTQLAMADNYVKQGLVEEAIEIYQQLAETHPGNPEIKQKLNQAYTAYVKTGEDVIGALEAEKKAKEEEEKNIRTEMERKAQEEAGRLRAELEQKARLEAERKVRDEMERKAREDAERKVRDEMERAAKVEVEKKYKEELERKTKEELEKRFKEESQRKIQEEAERKVRQEMEGKAREEAERKAREEAERKKASEKPKAAESREAATARTPPPSKHDALEENKDEFMTIAVADIYMHQGLLEEAAKIYRRIVQAEPDNLEAKKKLSDVEALAKSKSGKATSPAAGHSPDPPAPTVPPAAPSPHPPGPEKDSGGKKKSNRVGYV